MTTTTPQRSSGPPALSELLERIARVGTTDHWIVSCYLKLEPRDRTRGKYLIKLKNRIKERLAWMDERHVGRSERERVERDLRRIRDYLADTSNLPTGRGIAMFASEPLDLFEVVELPQVFRSRLAIDRSPLVRELVALHDEFGLILCAIYDRTSARLFKVTALGIEEQAGLTAGETTRAGRFHGERAVPGPGPSLGVAGEHNYNQRIRAEKDRHYADIGQRLLDMWRSGGVRGIVLATTRSDANAIVPHLHPYVREHLLGTTKLNPKTVTAPEVAAAVLNVRRSTERLWEADHVRELHESIGTGWAVNGLEGTLHALGKGQVRTLLVNSTAASPGYRCTQSGRLTTDDGRCEGDGPAEGVPDIVDEAIEEAMHQGGHVQVLEDNEARAQVDGLAAIFRFNDG